MKTKLPNFFFITGTDTGVGKTFVSTILVTGLKASYYKPIQAGFPTDTDFVKKYSLLPEKNFLKETHLFKLAASPHLSSKNENKTILLSDFILPSKINTSHLIVEGCGGLLVPINEKEFIIDLIKKFSIPTILVARSTLGTINHTLMSLNQLRSYSIPILGVVLNGPKNKENKIAIQNYGKVSIIAEIDTQKNIDKINFQKLFKENFYEKSK